MLRSTGSAIIPTTAHLQSDHEGAIPLPHWLSPTLSSRCTPRDEEETRLSRLLLECCDTLRLLSDGTDRKPSTIGSCRIHSPTRRLLEKLTISEPPPRWRH